MTFTICSPPMKDKVVHISVNYKSERNGKRNIWVFANIALLFLYIRVLVREIYLKKFTKFFVNVWGTQMRMLWENAVDIRLFFSNICHIRAVFMSLHVKMLCSCLGEGPINHIAEAQIWEFLWMWQSKCNWQITGSKTKRVLCVYLQCSEQVSLISGIKFIQVVNHTKINRSLTELETVFFLIRSLTWRLCSHYETSYFSITYFINLLIKFHNNIIPSEI